MASKRNTNSIPTLAQFQKFTANETLKGDMASLGLFVLDADPIISSHRGNFSEL